MNLAVGKILIVDDHPLNLKLVRVLLESEGHRVRTAVDAQEAADALKTFTPELIVMDVQLPHMDGLEFTRRLKLDGTTCAIPVLAVTAYAMKGDAEKALAAGCSAYVSKPIDIHALCALVNRLLAPAAPSPLS